jgi:Nickel responsive protein SCO4226-like
MAVLKKYMIEREVAGVGDMTGPKSAGPAETSNKALAQIKGIQWQQSFITQNKTYCVYLAVNEDVIREHAKLSGFPANKITEIVDVWDPSTPAHATRTR